MPFSVATATPPIPNHAPLARSLPAGLGYTSPHMARGSFHTASCLTAASFALRSRIVHIYYRRAQPYYVTGCFGAIGAPLVLVHVL